jgi:hypothetical protein
MSQMTRNPEEKSPVCHAMKWQCLKDELPEARDGDASLMSDASDPHLLG